MSIFKQRVNQKEIVEKYFSDPGKYISLADGDILIDQNEINHKLFYVRKGKIIGLLPDKHTTEPVFEADEDSFCGVYSYFSEDHRSYSRLIATEESQVYYYDDDPRELPYEEAEKFLGFLFKIVVLELRSRQYFAAHMARERQEAMNKLIKTEKLATLGQLSTGLAHELNNSIGSLTANLRQLQAELDELLINKKSGKMQQYYQKGLTDGLQLSSREARLKRGEWKNVKGFDQQTIKKLTKAGIRPNELSSVEQGLEAASLWNLGYILHDMKVVADQATHVIGSIKTMGIANQNWSKDVDVNRTILDAMAILRSLTRTVTLEVQLADDLTTIEACHGELVQVWVNLIKNAVESLTQHGIEAPRVGVKSWQSARHIWVSVEDNGPGIDPDIIGKIYEPSFTTKVGGISLGLGLGLTIVNRIVAEHNGNIKVTSKPGSTRFTVKLRKKLNM